MQSWFPMSNDANTIDEVERRRASFALWLSRAWDWAGDNGHPALANCIAEVLSHVDEPEYPLWFQAERLGITGNGIWAEEMRGACGVPVAGPRATGWEKEIGYSPIISLDPATWETVYRQLGWANRDTDVRMNNRNFWLVSAQGNIIRFQVRPPIVSEDPEV